MPALRIAEFDVWRPGYGQAEVRVLRAGTSVLASIYSDEDLTEAVDNPVTLAERVIDGLSFGKFSAPIYVGVPYELEINSVDRTGVSRPSLTTLEAADASLALVIADGGTEDVTLADHLARRIDVRDFGQFLAVGEQGASAATNTATLTAAIGVAGSNGGGYVELPAGTFRFNNVTLPEGVVLRGQSRGGTILQSTTAGRVVTIAGDRAGFCRLTLDGISLVTGSIGVYAERQDAIVFDDVLVKRFAVGIQRDGGSDANWRDLSISNCSYGYRAHGDENDTGAAELQFNYWRGGGIDTCSTIGLELKHDGRDCTDNIFVGLFFDSNTNKAVQIEGARATSFRDCRWVDNTKNIVVSDGDDDRTVIGLEVVGGSMEDGTIEMEDTLDTVSFRRVTIDTVTVTLTSPQNAVLVEDCRELDVTVSGDFTAWLRHQTSAGGSTFGVTTGNAATKGWAISLDPGEYVYLEGKVIARQRNGTNYGFYHIAVSARRPGASLAYDTQTANFTAGNIVTGGTSGATARIAADSDSGATGTLTLYDVEGTFEDNEIITDTGSGSATVNGTISTSDAALLGSVTVIRADQESDTDYNATFVANGPEIELRVTGDTSQTVEWTVHVDVVTSNE